MNLTLAERAQGALYGLAAADAAGFPALYHRQLAMPNRRRLLWTQALDGDAMHVNKFPVPFTLSADPRLMQFSATDDTEQVALAAQVLLESGQNPSVETLFEQWWRIVEPQAESVWGSVADRSAILNSQRGLRAPVTGNDNPHHYDDSSVIRSVPVGIRYAGAPRDAAEIASRMALITNADVGVEGAGAFAAVIAVVVAGGTIGDAVEEARSLLNESWTSRNLVLAESILEEAGSLFAAVPRWSDEIVSAEYNFGNVVAETLPLALLISRGAASFAEALGVAALIPKQADTMPAMVGAVLGAAMGVNAIPATWRQPVTELRGICVPSTAGVRLDELAHSLITTYPAVIHGT
jgi:ADP-ribosylglycohydrolase